MITLPPPEIDLPAEHLLRQLLDALAAHPEVRQPLLRVLLTEDFLALPERVGHLQTTLDDFREETRSEFRRVDARIDENTRQLSGHSRVLSEHTSQIQEHSRTISEHTSQIQEHSRVLSEHTSQIQEHSRTISEHTSQIQEHSRTISEHTSQIQEHTRQIQENTRQIQENTRQTSENTRQLRRLSSRVGNLIGASYEDFCRQRIGIILDGLLERPALADWELVNDQLREMRHHGLITRAEYEDGMSADIIACAKAAVAQPDMLFVGEVSITFNRGDLETAARRAAIIGRAVGVPTFAFLVTNYGWPDEADAIARQLGVTIIRHESDKHTDDVDDAD